MVSMVVKLGDLVSDKNSHYLLNKVNLIVVEVKERIYVIFRSLNMNGTHVGRVLYQIYVKLVNKIKIFARIISIC